MRVLDLFCGAGGAAMGLHQAWPDAEIVGVDIKPQKRYPFTFVQADAMTYPLEGFDFIWASPPCQAFVSLRFMYNAKKHDSLIEDTRLRLQASGIPYVIENVPGAPLENSVRLCGTSFDLGSGDAELWRHRHFESTFPIASLGCKHRMRERVIGVYGGHGRDRRRNQNTQDFPTIAIKEAMGIDWMTSQELSQAIPPAYSKYIGEQYDRYVNNNRKNVA